MLRRLWNECLLKTAKTRQNARMLKTIASKKNIALENDKKKWPNTQKARNLKNALEHATTYIAARACGILVHVYWYLITPLASKIRLALLVVNSVNFHLPALKELSITNVSKFKQRYSTISLQDTFQYLALFHL